MKPAPGPYSSGPKGLSGGNGVQTICVMDNNGRNIATVYGKENGEKAATAALLAASFDLLKEAKAYLDGTGRSSQKLEQAIMRAEGL